MNLDIPPQSTNNTGSSTERVSNNDVISYIQQVKVKHARQFSRNHFSLNRIGVLPLLPQIGRTCIDSLNAYIRSSEFVIENVLNRSPSPHANTQNYSNSIAAGGDHQNQAKKPTKRKGRRRRGTSKFVEFSSSQFSNPFEPAEPEDLIKLFKRKENNNNNNHTVTNNNNSADRSSNKLSQQFPSFGKYNEAALDNLHSVIERNNQPVEDKHNEKQIEHQEQQTLKKERQKKSASANNAITTTTTVATTKPTTSTQPDDDDDDEGYRQFKEREEKKKERKRIAKSAAVTTAYNVPSNHFPPTNNTSNIIIVNQTPQLQLQHTFKNSNQIRNEFTNTTNNLNSSINNSNNNSLFVTTTAAHQISRFIDDEERKKRMTQTMLNNTSTNRNGIHGRSGEFKKLLESETPRAAANPEFVKIDFSAKNLSPKMPSIYHHHQHQHQASSLSNSLQQQQLLNGQHSNRQNNVSTHQNSSFTTNNNNNNNNENNQRGFILHNNSSPTTTNNKMNIANLNHVSNLTTNPSITSVISPTAAASALGSGYLGSVRSGSITQRSISHNNSVQSPTAVNQAGMNGQEGQLQQQKKKTSPFLGKYADINSACVKETKNIKSIENEVQRGLAVLKRNKTLFNQEFRRVNYINSLSLIEPVVKTYIKHPLHPPPL